MSDARRRARMAHVLLLAVVAVWGSTFVLVKQALRDCSPLLFNQLRMTVAFAALALIHWREWRHMSRAAWLAGATAGVLLGAGYELQTAGLVYTTAVRSAFLTGTVVLLVPVFSLFPKVRAPGSRSPGMPALAGAAGALAGIVLLTSPPGVPLVEFTRGLNRGDHLSLVCAVAFALHLLSLSHLARRIPSTQLAMLQIGFAALGMTLTTPFMERAYIHWTSSLLTAVLVCALFATALAFSVQSWAQRHLAASHTAMLLALEPAFALLFSVCFLHERLTMRTGAGAALILTSIIFVERLAPGDAAVTPEGNVL